MSFIFTGEKAICFGDSITWYDGHTYNWGKEAGRIAVGFPSYLRAAGMQVCNEGISDATIQVIWDCVRNTPVTSYDYVFVTSGANDSRYGVTTKDFCDYLQHIIEYIRSQNARACIVLMTPAKGWIYAPLGYAYDSVYCTNSIICCSKYMLKNVCKRSRSLLCRFNVRTDIKIITSLVC